MSYGDHGCVTDGVAPPIPVLETCEVVRRRIVVKQNFCRSGCVPKVIRRGTANGAISMKRLTEQGIISL